MSSFPVVRRRGAHRAAIVVSLAAGIMLGKAVTPCVGQSAPDSIVLTGFDFDPQSVDVSDASATVTARISLSDPDGISSVFLNFSSPRYPNASASSSCFAESPSEGTVYDGVWSCEVSIPEDSLPGPWTAELQVRDEASNSTTYDASDLTALGFPVKLHVVSDRDIEPPLLAGFDFQPRAVDVRLEPAEITCRVSATDTGGSGVVAASVQFNGPGRSALCFADHLVSGTIDDGVWTGTTTIPQFLESATWEVSEVVVYDGGNNRRYGAEELTSRGFPTELAVTSDPDFAPPRLTAFDFTPTSVEVGSCDATVTCSISASDPVAGVNYIGCGFRSPTGFAATSCWSASPSSGTIHDGVWTCSVTVPHGGEPGTWVADAVDLTDRAYNFRRFRSEDLAEMGFRTELDVGQSASGPDLDGDGYGPPCDCDDSQADVHPGAVEACDRVDNDCDGTVDDAPAGCALQLTAPTSGDTVDCRRNAVPPTIAWQPGPYDRFRVTISDDSDFPARSTIGSGDTLLRTTSWAVPRKKWRRLCDGTRTSLYIRVLGVDRDVSRSDSDRRAASPTVRVSIQR
jgi:hypothetical protein